MAHDIIQWQQLFVMTDTEGQWGIVYGTCPNCVKGLVFLGRGGSNPYLMPGCVWTVKISALDYSRLIRPEGAVQPPLHPNVPSDLAEDYHEAAAVLPYSPKASAALSRRCLQTLLREAAHTTKRDLADQIDEVMPSLPPYLQKSIDAVRNTGNVAAHPMKSKSTGEILPVEPGEAEWNLEVLGDLFDFYYTQPARIEGKRDALNTKLLDAGKPPMK